MFRGFIESIENQSLYPTLFQNLVLSFEIKPHCSLPLGLILLEPCLGVISVRYMVYVLNLKEKLFINFALSYVLWETNESGVVLKTIVCYHLV